MKRGWSGRSVGPGMGPSARRKGRIFSHPHLSSCAPCPLPCLPPTRPAPCLGFPRPSSRVRLTFDAGLVGGDGGALDPDAVLLDGVRRVQGHLVVGRIAVRQAEVKVEALVVDVRVDQLFLSEKTSESGVGNRARASEHAGDRERKGENKSEGAMGAMDAVDRGGGFPHRKTNIGASLPRSPTRQRARRPFPVAPPSLSLS